MPDGPFHGLERGFLQNGGMERAPARVLAMSDQTVSGAEHAAVRFARGKYGIGRYDHGNTPDPEHVQLLAFIVHQPFDAVAAPKGTSISLRILQVEVH